MEQPDAKILRDSPENSSGELTLSRDLSPNFDSGFLKLCVTFAIELFLSFLGFPEKWVDEGVFFFFFLLFCWV